MQRLFPNSLTHKAYTYPLKELSKKIDRLFQDFSKKVHINDENKFDDFWMDVCNVFIKDTRVIRNLKKVLKKYADQIPDIELLIGQIKKEIGYYKGDTLYALPTFKAKPNVPFLMDMNTAHWGPALSAETRDRVFLSAEFYPEDESLIPSWVKFNMKGYKAIDKQILAARKKFISTYLEPMFDAAKSLNGTKFEELVDTAIIDFPSEYRVLGKIKKSWYLMNMKDKNGKKLTDYVLDSLKKKDDNFKLMSSDEAKILYYLFNSGSKLDVEITTQFKSSHVAEELISFYNKVVSQIGN